MPSESRHGKPAQGWSKFGTQLPRQMALEYREITSSAGSGGSKVMTTAAIALLMAMDEAERDTLCRYVIQKTWKQPSALRPSEVLSLFRALESSRENAGCEADEDMSWYVDKIVDPELTPEPGSKQSDRRGARRGKGA